MNGIITVLGHDRIGIIAKICTYLAEADINILDISQTIIKGYFNMVMVVDLSGAKNRFEKISDDLDGIGKELGLIVKIQHEEIFDSMHRI